MRILVLTPSLCDSAPGQRFRIEQWARYPRPHGYDFTFLPFEDAELHDCLYRPGFLLRESRLMAKAVLRRLCASLCLSRYDLIYIYREAAAIGPALLERLIALLGIPVIYDFDDPIWMTYRSPVNRRLTMLKCQSKTASICRSSDKVIVGNDLLRRYASRYSDSVFVMPSTIDLQEYPKRLQRRPADIVTLGWTGSHSTLPFLTDLLPVLRRLAKRRLFRLVVISHTDLYQIPDLGAEVVARKWNAATEAQDLEDVDIGLAPFPNVGWTPLRCHGKVLQYMAAGIPCVASNLGIIPEYIQDGISGYLATDDNEWLDRVTRLIDNAALRERMAYEGRKVVEDRYSAELWASRLGGILVQTRRHARG